LIRQLKGYNLSGHLRPFFSHLLRETRRQKPFNQPDFIYRCQVVVTSIVENGVLVIVVHTQNEQATHVVEKQITRRTGRRRHENRNGNRVKDQRNAREKRMGDHSQAKVG
jgi:hypothetical protein